LPAPRTCGDIVDEQAHRRVIEDRYLEEWVRYGLKNLDDYLRRHAAFSEWLDARERRR
jgi:hypothetical protein